MVNVGKDSITWSIWDWYSPKSLQIEMFFIFARVSLNKHESQDGFQRPQVEVGESLPQNLWNPVDSYVQYFMGTKMSQKIIASIVGFLHRSRLLSKTFMSQVWYRKSRKNRLLKFPWRMHGANGTFTYYFLPWNTNQTVGKYTLRPVDPSWDILHLPAKPSHLRGIGILRIHSVEVSHVLKRGGKVLPTQKTKRNVMGFFGVPPGNYVN